ncbi:MAG: retropepsin-like aspartic protease [Polyangia bacterium]
MKLVLRANLPFVTVRITHEGASIDIDNVLIDTGSASTVLSADRLAALGITPRPTDPLRTLRGIGGRELVFTRLLERIDIGEMGVEDFEVEVGGMDYGFAIHGIVGMDFLMATHAVLDLSALTIEPSTR